MEQLLPVNLPEELITMLARASNDAISITDKEGLIRYSSPNSRKLYGYDLEDAIIGKHATEFIAPEYHQKASEYFQKALSHGIIEHVEYVFVRKDGSRFNGELTAARIDNPAGEPVGFVATIRDYTERNRIQQEIEKLKRFEALGIFAGGIGHDLNNILSCAMGNLYFLEEKYKDHTDSAPLFESLKEACGNATALAKELMLFSKGDEIVLHPIDLKALIFKVIKSLGGHSNIACQCNINEEIPFVFADEIQLYQVFNNLLLNASQSMNMRGTVIIDISTSRRSDPIGNMHATWVKTSIRDHGPGISQESIHRIFEPYYTTKEFGSGLGLAVTNSIVTKHKGWIDVESDPGQGSTFNVYLPYMG